MSRSSQASSHQNRSGLRNRRTRTRDDGDWHSLNNVEQQNAGHMDDIRPRRERTRQDDYLYYSLAGPPAPPPRYDQHQTYYDEGYLDLNPWMQQEDEGPNFTLARNFPRIVRWKGNDRDVKADEKGESEMAPQVEAAEELGDAVENGEEDRGKRFSSDCLLYVLMFWEIPSTKPEPCKKKKRQNTAVGIDIKTNQVSSGVVPTGQANLKSHQVQQTRNEIRPSRSISGLLLE